MRINKFVIGGLLILGAVVFDLERHRRHFAILFDS